MSDDRSDLEEAIRLLRRWLDVGSATWTFNTAEATRSLLARHPEKPKLLPCPFCGGEPEQVGHSYGWVSCKSCQAEGPTTAMPSALDGWNRRATPVGGPVNGGKGE